MIDKNRLKELFQSVVEMTRKEVLIAVIGGVVIVWLLTTLYSMNQKIESMDRTLSIIESTVGGRKSSRTSSRYMSRNGEDTVMEKLNANYYLLNDIEARLRGE